jgi:hypothetical protein
MRLGPLRRKPQLHLRPESLALPKVTLGIKRETPQHLVLHLLSILHLVHPRIQVCRGFPSGHAAVAVCRRGPVGCGRLRGGEEFEFDGDGGGGAAGYGVEDVAGYEGAFCHGWRGAGLEGWYCCRWLLEVGCELSESVGRGVWRGGHRLKEGFEEGV